MSKVKKVLRTIIAEEVAREVRQLIEENQEAQQGQQEVSPAGKLIDRVLPQGEVKAFAQYLNTIPKLVMFLMELIDHIADEHKLQDDETIKALTLLLRQTKQVAKQDKLKGDEAAKEAMRRT